MNGRRRSSLRPSGFLRRGKNDPSRSTKPQFRTGVQGFTSFKFSIHHIAFGSQGTLIQTSSFPNLFSLHVTCKICMLNIPAHFVIAKFSTSMLFRVDFEVLGLWYSCLGFEVEYWTRLADGDWKHGGHNWFCSSSLPYLFHLHVICTFSLWNFLVVFSQLRFFHFYIFVCNEEAIIWMAEDCTCWH